MTGSFWLLQTKVDPSVYLFILVILLLIVWANKKQRDGLNWPPGPRPWPIVGNILQMGNDSLPFKKLKEFRKKYGDVFTIWFGPIRVVFLNGAAIKDALLQPGDTFSGRPDISFFRNFLKGRTISFSSINEEWHTRHKSTKQAVGELMNKGHLQTIVNAEINATLEVFKNTKATPFNCQEILQDAVGRTIFQMCFGPLEGQHGKDTLKRYVQAIVGLPDELPYLMLAELYPVLEPFLRKHKRAFYNKSDYLVGIIDNHRSYLEEMGLISESEEYAENSIMDILKQKDADLYKYVILDLMGAGTDVLSTTMYIFILYMTIFPDVQTKIKREINESLDVDDIIEPIDIAKLPYTEATIYEILRHARPTMVGIPHATTRDAKINGYDIAKGTVILPNYESILYDDQLWKDPFEFNPNRMLTSTGQVDVEKKRLIPAFGIGKRKCLGKPIGQMSIHLFVMRIMQACSFRPVLGEEPSLDWIPNLVLRPKPFKVRIQI
ncbi:unnamed protein product [Owenia fusiformis]|uniref:Uncharacterized protein n=1 Tax=Owenia fusiformis TaxID=6347 RepID=A0A8J1XW08_OWEFU|nr:unnamed protein product [Owenia fusiformis]